MSTEHEAEASAMGWQPKDQFKGDPAKWVDAETFMKRGEEVMPILRANNKKLQEQLATVQGANAKLQEQVTAAHEAIEALKEFNNEFSRKEAKKTKAELKAGIKEARQAGDVDTELELQEQLTAVDEALEESEETSEPPKTSKKPVADTADPVFEGWKAKNSWFGPADPVKTQLAVGIAQKLRAEGNTETGEVFLDKCAKEAAKILARRDQEEEVNERVESGGRQSGNGMGGGSKTYNDLPSDAKEVCERQAKRLVGEGRAYKTIQEWRAAYAEKYFAQD